MLGFFLLTLSLKSGSDFIAFYWNLLNRTFLNQYIYDCINEFHKSSHVVLIQ